MECMYSVAIFKKNNLHQLIISWNDAYLDLNLFAVKLFRSGWSKLGDTGAILMSAFMYHNPNIIII